MKKKRRSRSRVRSRVQSQLNKVRSDEAIRRKAIRKRLHGKQRKQTKKKIIKIMIGSAAVIVLLFLLFEFLLPGSFLKKKKVIDDEPLVEILEAALVDDEEEKVIIGKEYAKLEGITEEQLLWDLLTEYFNGNEAAVLGVMCNLHAESGFVAANLEDYNNRLWDISDDIYTEEVNRRTIDKKDFLESRTVDSTNGYYNDYNQWVNRDGGYGYAQFTSYDKKEALYQFAEQWFGPGGEGEDYKFNIGDPVMQAHYVIALLGTEEFREMEELIRNSTVPVDACYYWLKMYEEPYDPYADNYYTLAFERAEVADDIRTRCTGGGSADSEAEEQQNEEEGA